jgi:hypothetical protein
MQKISLNIVKSLVFIGLGWVSGQALAQNWAFSDFPVTAIYNENVNLAGTYLAQTTSCGTQCQQTQFTNLKTGKRLDSTLTSSGGIQTRPASRLIVVEQCNSDYHCQSEYWILENDGVLVQLHESIKP